jgi:catechol 2,3-dioxygenase-like lactoylglutathione lyase family enzyme
LTRNRLPRRSVFNKFNEGGLVIMSEKVISENLVHTIVQVRLPAKDINESVEWYEKNFGFKIIWKTEEESDLKLEPSPFLFLKRVEEPSPVHIVTEGKPYAVISFKTSNVKECYRRLVEAGEEVTEITNTWNIDRFLEFNVKDPVGNVINVANYPDL